MDKIIIEMLPANEGDCFLITLSKANKRILIDGGTADTYRDFLKKRLLQLKANGNSIDLLIVTHIDDDHIGGIIELLKENGLNTDPKIVEIKEIWHNSYRHLQFEKQGELLEVEKKILEHYVISGNSKKQLSEANGSKNISAKQGTTLGALILRGGYNWNGKFDGRAINADDARNIDLGEDCWIKVLTPTKAQLKGLEKKWKKELQSKRINFHFSEEALFDDAYEYFLRYFVGETIGVSEEIAYNGLKQDLDLLAEREGMKDESLTNRSSISILLNYHGRRLLLLGDSVMEEAIAKLDGIKEVEVVKVAHHGSLRNSSKKSIEEIVAKKYLISTNSAKYNHPDLETIAKIICKQVEYEKTIFFNYNIAKIDMLLSEIKEEHNTKVICLENDQSIEILCEAGKGDETIDE